METNPPTTDPKQKSEETFNPGDEKTKIIEDFSPEKSRTDKTPLPKISSEQTSK